ncbi:MAG: amidohydrolase family protein, partial [Myxococcales bacterium]|nr:amidohydrolase family protein [Myxococcales bacterium]
VRLGGLREGSRGVALTQLRSLLDDARLYRQDPKAFDPHRFGRPHLSRLDLEALAAVVAGEAPLLAWVNRRADITAALALAAEQGIRLVVVGGAEAWAEAAALAAAQVPVVLNPLENLPGDFDRRLARPDSAAILVKAGVTVALSTWETHNVRKLRQLAGNAVRAGLPHAQAVQAITAAPGRVLGVPALGTLRPGARADLVLWSGDPLELSSRAEQVLIGGRVMPAAHRQADLLHRYRQLDPGR